MKRKWMLIVLVISLVTISVIGWNVTKARRNDNNVVYTVDQVDSEGYNYHAVSGSKSVSFTLNDVDGMITGVGDKVSVDGKGVVSVK